MSNISKAKTRQPVPTRGKNRLTDAEKLKTLRLYIRHGGTNRVGEELGISGATVRDRLFAMGVKLKPNGYSEVSVEEVNGRDNLARIIRELST